MRAAERGSEAQAVKNESRTRREGGNGFPALTFQRKTKTKNFVESGAVFASDANVTSGSNFQENKE